MSATSQAGRATAADLPRERLRAWAAGGALAAILGAALLLRLYTAAVAYCSNFDTATVGLMALHILKGAHPLFFYGQNYMGSLEAYLAALLFAVFGPTEIALALSPILFSLAWIAATYLLFRELLGRSAGLAAALCVAVPSWVIVWYSVGSYGGYPCAFFLGTTGLWLSVRIAGRDLAPASLWRHVLLLGLVAGLALWTHYMSAAYLLTGAVLLLGFFIRRRFAPRVLLPFVAGAVPFLIGASPIAYGYRRFAGAPVGSATLDGRILLRHFTDLAGRPLRHHISPVSTLPEPLQVAVLVCLCLAGALYAWRLWKASRAERGRLLVPALFLAVMLALYLPNPMAGLNAPRYTMLLWIMMPCGAFGAAVTAPAPWLRRAAWALLAAWIAYYGASDIVLARGRAEKRDAAMDHRGHVVEAARRAGANTVMMAGGQIFGHEGQVFDFASGGQVAFVSCFDERYQPAAQASEADPRTALMCENTASVEATLKDMDVAYRTCDAPGVRLLYDLQAVPRRRRSVPPADMRAQPLGAVSGDAAQVLDRTRETCVAGTCDGESGLTLDLGRSRRVDGLWLCSPESIQSTLPQGYRLEMAGDDGAFHTLRAVPRRTASAYLCDDHVYFKGYFSMMECRFAPADARFLRLVFTGLQHNAESWQISELFVFEDTGPTAPVSDAEIAKIAGAIQTNGVDFTMADRWLSARLLAALPAKPAAPPAFPRYNPKYLATHLSRFVEPRAGLALAVASEVADECETLLRAQYGGAVTWKRMDFERYTLLAFKAPGRIEPQPLRLVWNGHTLLRTGEANRCEW